MNEKIETVKLFAWVGPDDSLPIASRTGEIGIKRGLVPAGDIPLVATRREKIDRPALREAMAQMADATGQPRMLVRFVFQEVLLTIEPDPEATQPSGRIVSLRDVLLP